MWQRYTGGVEIVKIMQPFHRLLMRSVGDELTAAALVDRRGDAVCLAGGISENEAMPLAALVMYRLNSDNLAERLFTGEVISLMLDDRAVAVATAKRQLFVVALLRECTASVLERVGELRDGVAKMLQEHDPGEPPPVSGGARGGSGSTPAELRLVEFGITVPRVRPKA